MKNKQTEIRTHYSVICDTCGEAEELLEINKARAVTEAEGMGWKFKKGDWRCPRCLTGDECF